MRRVILSLVAVVLVNLPWANDAWVEHRIDSQGVHVTATVVKDAQKHGDNFVSYRLPKKFDPKQTLYGVQVSKSAYTAAVSRGTIEAQVIPGHPNDNRLQGQVTGSLVYVIAGVGNAIVAIVLGSVLLRRRRWTRFAVTAVEGDLVTVRTGSDTLTVVLEEPPAVGTKLRGSLHLVPSEDVVEGPPIGEVTHLEGARYRIVGRAKKVGPTQTDITLENGVVLPAISDEVEHEAELRGPVLAVGTLVLNLG